MTTATPRGTRRTAARVLFGSAGFSLAVGVFVPLVALVVAEGDALLGALVGAALAAAVLVTGAMVVDLVADLMPAASLLVALLTYALQLALLALVLVAIDRSAAASEALATDWFGAGMIATCLAWTAAQVRLATTARVPLYDLPRASASGALEGSER